jgi:hypothetical protein
MFEGNVLAYIFGSQHVRRQCLVTFIIVSKSGRLRPVAVRAWLIATHLVQAHTVLRAGPWSHLRTLHKSRGRPGLPVT